MERISLALAFLRLLYIIVTMALVVPAVNLDNAAYRRNENIIHVKKIASSTTRVEMYLLSYFMIDFLYWQGLVQDRAKGAYFQS